MDKANEPSERPGGVQGSGGSAPALSFMDPAAMNAAAGAASQPVATPPLPASREQLDAIGHEQGPALVLAAPGSGKTFVITERYLRLLRDHHLAPDRVLVLTYNNQAAVQLRDRVRDRIEPGGSDADTLTTYNAFAVGLLSTFGWRKGWAPPRVVEDTEQDLLLLDVLRELALESLYDPAVPLDAVRDVREIIQRAKQELVTPARYHAGLRSASTSAQRSLEVATKAVDAARKDFEAALKAEGRRNPVAGPSSEVRRTSDTFEHAKDQFEEAQNRLIRLRADQDRQLDVARVYDRIEAVHKQRGLIDHDDCVLRAIELVKTVPECREWVRSFRYVMVDEYQDTNRAQAELVKAVVGNRKGNVLVVADDDQSIYMFRGASRANINRFRHDFPGRVEIQLPENRRSTPEIVAVSRSVIEGTSDREIKPLRAVRPSGARPEILRAANASDEAAEIAERISRLILSGTLPQEIAVLVRNRKEMDPIAEGLRDAHIPYIASGGVSYFQSPEVKDAMAMFSVIVNPDNSLALLRCLAQPNWRLSPLNRWELNREMLRTGRPLISLLRSAKSLGFLEDVDRATISRVVDRIDQMGAMALTETASAVFWEAVRETGYCGIADGMEDLQRQQVGANLYRLADIIEGMGARGEIPSFTKAERYLRIKQAAGAEAVAPLSPEAKGVQLSTIHGAKGREWDHVFVAGLTEGRLPTRQVPTSLDLPATFIPEGIGGSANHLAEERRLFYVAITRPRLSLTVTYADRYAGGFERTEKPSRFLGTIADELVERKVIRDHLLVASKVRLLPGSLRKMPERLSYSSLRTWDECPRRYEFRYIWRLPEEPQENTRLGILVHHVLQEAVIKRMAGETIDRGAVIQLWCRACEGPGGFPPADGGARMMGERMLGRYVDSNAWQDAHPDAVEKEFVVQIGASTFGGKLDRIDRRPDGLTIVDYKTGSVEPAVERLRGQLQPMVYAVAAGEIYRTLDVTCEFHNLRTGGVSRVSYDASQLKRARWLLERKIAGLAEAYLLGRFKAKPGTRGCRNCGFRICEGAPNCQDQRPRKLSVESATKVSVADG
jgi:DNA helicase-2/ATP-dependent DNA helicase PcrA